MPFVLPVAVDRNDKSVITCTRVIQNVCPTMWTLSLIPLPLPPCLLPNVGSEQHVTLVGCVFITKTKQTKTKESTPAGRRSRMKHTQHTHTHTHTHTSTRARAQKQNRMMVAALCCRLCVSLAPELIPFHSSTRSVTEQVVQWKRAGPITQESMGRNHALLICFLFHVSHRLLPAS